MKYISKQQSLSLTLRSGIPASKVAGTQPVPGIHLRFEHSRADTASLINLGVTEEEAIEMVERHRSFNISFFRAEDAPIVSKVINPIPGLRHKMETMTGGVPSLENPEKKPVKFSEEQKAYMRDFLKEEVDARVAAKLEAKEEVKPAAEPVKKTTKKKKKK